jgi:biotin carboxyl carrier protein
VRVEFEIILNDTKYRIQIEASTGDVKKIKVNDQDFDVTMLAGDGGKSGRRTVSIGGKDHDLKLLAHKLELGRAEFELEVNDKLAELEAILPHSNGQEIYQDSSNNIAADIKSHKEEGPERVKEEKKLTEVSAEGGVYAPMPGRIVAYKVKVGDRVKAGQVVAILEAMKMENELKAPKSGTVRSLLFNQGDNVQQNKPIMIIE